MLYKSLMDQGDLTRKNFTTYNRLDLSISREIENLTVKIHYTLVFVLYIVRLLLNMWSRIIATTASHFKCYVTDHIVSCLSVCTYVCLVIYLVRSDDINVEQLMTLTMWPEVTPPWAWCSTDTFCSKKVMWLAGPLYFIVHLSCKSHLLIVP